MSDDMISRALQRLEERSLRELVLLHEQHATCGRGTEEDGPEDSDCLCRTTSRRDDCARAGCGFCSAARCMEKVAGHKRFIEMTCARENEPGFEGWCSCGPRVGRLIHDVFPAICGDCKKRIDPRQKE